MSGIRRRLKARRYSGRKRGRYDEEDQRRKAVMGDIDGRCREVLWRQAAGQSMSDPARCVSTGGRVLGPVATGGVVVLLRKRNTMTLDDMKREAEADGWRVVYLTTGKSISFLPLDWRLCALRPVYQTNALMRRHGDCVPSTRLGTASIPAVLAIPRGPTPVQEPTMIDDDPNSTTPNRKFDAGKARGGGWYNRGQSSTARRCGGCFTLHGLAKAWFGKMRREPGSPVKMPY